MTGWGSFRDLVKGCNFTYGFDLFCTRGAGQDYFNIYTTDGDRFQLSSIDMLECRDDPTFDPGLPMTNFDTIEFSGMGRVNSEGAGGYFNNTPMPIGCRVSDGGEPGVGVDYIDFVLGDPGNPWIAVFGWPFAGNHNALPH